MMGVSHLLLCGTATSLILSTANPVILTVGAAAGLLPDVDISTSPAGRVLPWVSRWLERRFPHRSCTHSFAASLAIAFVTYSSAFFWELNICRSFMPSILATSLVGLRMLLLSLELRCCGPLLCAVFVRAIAT